jgi:hypothetical protein
MSLFRLDQPVDSLYADIRNFSFLVEMLYHPAKKGRPLIRGYIMLQECLCGIEILFHIPWYPFTVMPHCLMGADVMAFTATYAGPHIHICAPIFHTDSADGALPDADPASGTFCFIYPWHFITY